MTQKDLLYLEDAVMHEDNLINLWTYFASLISDEDLKVLLDSENKKHESIKKKIIKVMEGLASEW